MKLLVVADRVEQHLLASPAARRDRFAAILACGDLPPEYLVSLRNLYDTPLYYVLGNHDLRFSPPPAGCLPLHCRMEKLDWLQIAGFSGSRWYNGGINQYREVEMRRFIRRMGSLFWRQGTPNLIIAHTPPRGIGDREDPPHRGFSCFHRLIRRCRPQYFLHGHIHSSFTAEAERCSTLGSTTVINCFGSHVLEIDP